MSAGRFRRGCAVYVGPLACALAALLALFWVGGLQGSEDIETAEDEELTELVSDLTSALTGDGATEASSETFLEVLSVQTDEEGDASVEPVVVAWSEDSDLVATATEVLESYADLDEASLATSGYLDLQGNAWGALVRGGQSWVDIVYVTTEDDEESTVRIVRLLPETLDGEDG